MTTPDGDAPAGSTGAGPGNGNGDGDDLALPQIRTTIVVLTAIRQAKALAGLAALASLDAEIVPSGRGAIAVRYVEQDPFEVDPEELLSGIPAAGNEFAAAVSLIARTPVVLMTSRIDDAGAEIQGQVKARAYAGGTAGDDLPPGLVLAQADSLVEDLLLGRRTAQQVAGWISTSAPVPPGRPRFGIRRRSRGRGGEETGE